MKGLEGEKITYTGQTISADVVSREFSHTNDHFREGDPQRPQNPNLDAEYGLKKNYYWGMERG